jgi:hypothetical protein
MQDALDHDEAESSPRSRQFCTPIAQMAERIALDAAASPTDHCLALLRALEMTLKFKVALLAALTDDGIRFDRPEHDIAIARLGSVLRELHERVVTGDILIHRERSIQSARDLR